MLFSFDVTVSTHDLLKQHVTERRLKGSQHNHHRVVVEAETHTEAFYLVFDMVFAQGHYVTGIYDRI